MLNHDFDFSAIESKWQSIVISFIPNFFAELYVLSKYSSLDDVPYP